MREVGSRGSGGELVAGGSGVELEVGSSRMEPGCS